MFGIVKRDNLTKEVQLKDIKYYLEQEYDRANERENNIRQLENKIIGLKETELKYNAMLVVQEKREERYNKQEETIKDLRKQVSTLQDNLKKEIAKQTDIKINAENKIKELKEQIKELQKEKKVKK